MSTKNKTWIARGAQANRVYETQIFNIDNGAGTTIDDVFYCRRDTVIDSIYPVYTEASGAVTSATWQVGVAAAGATIVAAVALEASKAVGDAGTAGVILVDAVAAGTTLFIRHTGIAVTVAGQYKLRIEYHVKP